MMPYGAWGGNFGFPNTACGAGGQMGIPWAGQTWSGTYGPGQFMPGAFGPGFGMGGGYPGFGGFAGGQMPGGFGMMPGFAQNPWPVGTLSPVGLGWGLGGLRRWGGTYSPQFVMTGLPTDDETTEMAYDAIDADPLIPFDADINVDTDAGTVTLSGTVTSKQIKHAAGDDAWWIPGVDDVRNDLQVQPRRGRQEGREGEEAVQGARGRTSGAPTRMRR